MSNWQSAVILVFNDQQELALQLRAEEDDSYPLHWDFSAAGGIDGGEDPKEAASRELKEELGIEGVIEFVAKDIYQDKDSIDNLYIYKTIHNGPFNPNPKEVKEIKFFKLDDIEEMLTCGDKFHPEFSFLWNKGTISNAKV